MNGPAGGGVDPLGPAPSTEAATYQRLRAHLAALKLTAAAEALTSVLDAARAEDLVPAATLERLLGAEVSAAAARRHAALLRLAALPAPYTLADSGFTAQPGVDEKLIRELACLHFLDEAGNVLFVGQPGGRSSCCRFVPPQGRSSWPPRGCGRSTWTRSSPTAINPCREEERNTNNPA